MATQEYAASIQGVGIRVTRLDATGNLLNGPGDSYTTSSFTRVSFTPEYEEGDEITEKSASGAVCVTYKSPDTLKRITLEVAICEPDSEITNLISGGALLRKNLGTFGSPNVKSIGWASPAIGDDPSGNGVAIEAWSLAIKEGKQAGVLPFYQWIFPYAKLRQSGDRVIENGAMATTFEGFGLGNIAFGTGPDGRWEYPSVTDRPYSYARTSWAPTGLNGHYTWHGQLTAAVTNRALASEVATLTTSTPHGFAVGESVTVGGMTSGATALNGTRTITAVTSTTFSYRVPGATDIASAAQTPNGSATVPAGPRAVNDLPTNTDGASAFNVPGNTRYNADRPTDFIVTSNNDPSV